MINKFRFLQILLKNNLILYNTQSSYSNDYPRKASHFNQNLFNEGKLDLLFLLNSPQSFFCQSFCYFYRFEYFTCFPKNFLQTLLLSFEQLQS